MAESEDASQLFRNTVEIMNAAGISIAFRYTYLTDSIDEYVNTMAKKLLAGDTDYDLFMVSSEMPTLFKSRYFENLYSYEVLADRYDHMIPGLKELMTIDGKTALMPLNDVRVTSIRFREKEMGRIYDFPKTYDEFFRFHDEIADDLPDHMYYFGKASPFNTHAEWLYEIYSNFMARTISNETAETDLLKIFTDMTKLDRYDSIPADHDEYMMYNEKNMKPAIELLPNGGEVYSDYYTVFPKLGDSYRYSADFTALGLNPNSPNKDMAAAFMAYYMNALDEFSSGNLLYTDKAENYRMYGETIAQNRYQSFKEQLADSIRYTYNDDFRGLCFDLGNELQSGEITPSEAAAEAFRYMKMARDE